MYNLLNKKQTNKKRHYLSKNVLKILIQTIKSISMRQKKICMTSSEVVLVKGDVFTLESI